MRKREPGATWERAKLLQFHLFRRLGRWILPGYRLSWPQIGWWRNEEFNRYLDRFGERSGQNTDRRWMLFQLLRLVDGVPGETAECGVYRGASSYLVCRRNREIGREGRHHLFDSFAGLSAPRPVDGRHWRAGDLACPRETVESNLAEFDDVVFHAGWIPERFGEVADSRFAFVHVDVDLHQPTSDSLRFFYPRLEQGAVLLCDDYGFENCPGATRAVDEFLEDKPEKMISLPRGGGFLIRGTRSL
jgi:hypothetical protein